jgi:hypothetical protein
MESLQSHIESALSFAQYQTTINQQRRLLKDKFESDTIFAYNGSLFKLSQEWLGSFDVDNNWCIDVNGNPAYIENPTEFLLSARSVYHAALKIYGEEFSKLRSQRTVKALTDV